MKYFLERIQNIFQDFGRTSLFLYFSFQHQMSLVRDASLFTERVSRAPISGNIDNPEGGLDALMQVMVCGEKFACREGARRVIIYTSDQVSHIQG